MARGDWLYLQPRLFRKRLCRETVKSVLDRGFAKSGFHRIFARLDAANQGSIGVVERLGMRAQEYRLTVKHSSSEGGTKY
ncbi:GNAT family N-acetyltransferase [Serratia grimesii]|uniref:GNAT family N-acetyltransferase n=1 Tax=Serratia grimesii TaxID=82995 RepID=UPI00383A1C31